MKAPPRGCPWDRAKRTAIRLVGERTADLVAPQARTVGNVARYDPALHREREGDENDLADSMASPKTFGLVDYCVFGSVLMSSLLIGAYHAFRGKQTNAEMLLGGRNMAILPVAISIMASFLSAILILGSPAEVYANGAEYWVVALAFVVVPPLVALLYLPIFYRCGLTSVNEYLQLRFESRVLRISCVLGYLVQTSLYMAIVLYAPSLALSSTTGLSLETSIICTAVVATLNATMGGLKGVVWANVLQSAVMGAGMVAIVVQGSINVGGFRNIFSINAEHGRMSVFNFNMSPWQRHNFWNLIFGTMFMWTGLLAVNQSSVQRYISLPTLKAGRTACLLNAPAIILYNSLACLCGLAIFATYADCDPLRMGLIERKDQLVPYFVLDQMSYLMGLPGLFVACIISGALSVISSGLNSLAAITWQDFLYHANYFQKMSPATQCWITRMISLLYGCLTLAMGFLASQLGGVLQASLAVTGAVSGPILGVFTLGILVPFANAKVCLVEKDEQ
ncbi:sodium-coupled monocarboxylate transporter 1-like [Pollicipes pollicipes]|uniref:sodium-coupled monocarboxylate transporter 1-like n=1 Tax=Pollicipes pollicipes TaxID=41117 RepID=UPI00188535FC|nr:sodium-coupled monocarboxylate transporter 1-like [Pollicipes pollicipes]